MFRRALLLAACLAPPALAGDWPGWRGPDGMGHSDESKPPLPVPPMLELAPVPMSGAGPSLN